MERALICSVRLLIIEKMKTFNYLSRINLHVSVNFLLQREKNNGSVNPWNKYYWNPIFLAGNNWKMLRSFKWILLVRLCLECLKKWKYVKWRNFIKILKNTWVQHFCQLSLLISFNRLYSYFPDILYELSYCGSKIFSFSFNDTIHGSYFRLEENKQVMW